MSVQGEKVRLEVRVAAGALTAALVALMGWWMVAGPSGADEEAAFDTAEAFVTAWNDGDWRTLDRLTVSQDGVAGDFHARMTEELQIAELDIGLDVIQFEEERTRAIYDAELELEWVGGWSYRGAFALREHDDGWLVDWAPSAFHPHLIGTRSFRLLREWEERAPILAVDGSVLKGPTDVRRIGIEPRRIGDESEVRSALVDVAGVPADEVDSLLDREDLNASWFYPLAEVSAEGYENMEARLAPVEGIIVQAESGRGALVPGLGRYVLGETETLDADAVQDQEPAGVHREGDQVGTSGLEGAFEQQLAGRPSAELQLIRPDPSPSADEPLVIDVVLEDPGVSPEALQTHLDPEIQTAAEQAIAGITDPAALVAIDVPSGGIRAAANNAASGFDRALGGRYPPGSTFKIVTAAAALRAGLTPETPVDCPAEYAVDGRDFRNAGDRQLGTVGFRTLFAESCNTGLIATVDDIGGAAVFDAAESFGFNVAYDIGISSFRGSYPMPRDPVEAAAQAIGQGRVEASVAHMASVGAAAVSGTWRSPVLTDRVAQAERDTGVDDAVMRDLMGAVVASGTGTGASLAGEPVLGKTGSAEFGAQDPPESHAWFVAVRGDLAMAVVIEGGGAGGDAAAPATARFYSSLE